MAEPTSIAQGRHWDELAVGSRFRTISRTVTEADLVNFIGATGMLEQMFVDARHDGAIGGRPVPAALTYCFVEGMQMQSIVQGTGLALLEVTVKVDGPVRVGDTIRAIIEVTAARRTSRGGRGIVSFLVTILNQNEEQVMHYTVTRMMAESNGYASR